MLNDMDLLAKAPRANPTLATIIEIERILKEESRNGDALPLSISEIERRMQAKRTRRDTVKAAIAALEHFGVAMSGSKGVAYARASPDMLRRRTVPLK